MNLIAFAFLFKIEFQLSIWCNPHLKIYEIVKYLLQNSPENSNTWAINLRHLFRMYEIEDPLILLQRDPLPKSHFIEYVLTKILAFHEKELRVAASKNSKMKYLNVSCEGLRGRHHPQLNKHIDSNRSQEA